MLASRRARKLLAILAVALIAIVVAPVLAWRPFVRPWMYARVGEKQVRELVKGTVAYLHLQLTQPLPDLAPYTPMPYADQPPFGVNTFLEQEVEAAKVARSLDMIHEAGFRFVRQEFPWEDIEISAKGDCWDHKWGVSAWAKYDRIVELASQRGLQVIARLDNPPAWARTGDRGESLQGPPDRVHDFGDFVEAVVRRYKGKVRYYQIWNEPNLYHEWGDQPVDAAAYTRLLQEAYRRAKAADPDCVILSAALAQTIERGPRDLSDLTYLQAMYDAGAKDYFDILGVQAYGLWTGPTDHRVGPDRTNFARVQLTRAIMVRNGDAAKPMWATELGWNAIPVGAAAPPVYGRVTRQEQARYGVEAYELAQREWPWMGVMNYWFFRRVSDAEKDQAFYYFGLLEPDFAPWPACAALRDYFHAPPVLYPGYHQESHWTLEYSGAWEARDDPASVLGSYRHGGPGARLRFTFWGSALDLVCFGQADPSAVRVLVDGRPARSTSTQVGGRPALAVVRSLGPGRHSVEVEIPAGSAGLPLDGLIVRGEDRRGGYALAGGAVVLVGLVAGWLAYRSRRGGPGR